MATANDDPQFRHDGGAVPWPSSERRLFAERVASADELKAAAYRRAREQLEPYRSAILLPETLLLLPAGDDLRRQVWAVDFEVVTDDDGLPEIVGSKVRKIRFLD